MAKIDVLGLAKDTFTEWSEDKASRLGAAVAFYTVFSLAPLLTVVILPAVVSLLPGVDLNAPLSLVPVLNTSLVSKEIVAGTYHWNYIALIFASSCAYAAAALWVAVKLFQREDVLFRT